jgi:hypothetical protein
MPSYRFLPIAGFVLLSGCVLHSPYKVVRYSVDFNTERQVNAQVEAYDHLPLKPTRIKLMRWGYNVGALPSGTGTLGWGTGRCKHRGKTGECEPEMMMIMEGPTPLPAPEPTTVVPKSPALQPLVPPPAPPADVGVRWNDTSVRQAAYRGVSPATNRASQAAWMFGAPGIR